MTSLVWDKRFHGASEEMHKQGWREEEWLRQIQFQGDRRGWARGVLCFHGCHSNTSAGEQEVMATGNLPSTHCVALQCL